MFIQIILSSIVATIIFYFVYLLSLINEFDLAVYETEIAVALTILAIGVLYWGFKPLIQKAGVKISDFDEKLEQKITFREDPYNRKDHLQTLNFVYQKLSVIRLAEQQNYSYNIETIVNYTDWKRNLSLSRSLGSLVGSELDWIRAEDLEPNLKRALKHLEQHDNHKNIVELWQKLQTQVNKYNNSIPKLTKFLENYIRTVMNEKTNYKEYHKEDQDRGYHLGNIQKTLMTGFYLQLAQPESVNSFLNIELKQVYNLHVWYEDFEGGYPLITVKKEDQKPDINEIRNLFLSIIRDENVLKECKSYHDLYVQIIKHTSKEFQNAMRNLVEDIENNGYVVEGICDLGY